MLAGNVQGLTTAQLRNHFSQYGTIKQRYGICPKSLPSTTVPGETYEVAFVYFLKKEAADRASATTRQSVGSTHIIVTLPSAERLRSLNGTADVSPTPSSIEDFRLFGTFANNEGKHQQFGTS